MIEPDWQIVNLESNVRQEGTVCYLRRAEMVQRLRCLTSVNYSWLRAVLLHGSYATGMLTNFSDVDLLLVLDTSADALSDQEKLRLSALKVSLERVIHRTDPLMHHGVDVVSRDSFADYDESFLPIDTLTKSVVLTGATEFPIRVNREKSLSNAKKKLRHMCDSVLAYKPTLANRTPYKCKCLLSVFFLIPVLLLQSDKGIFRYKADSIEIARATYANQLPFDAFDQVSEIRDSWRVSWLTYATRNALIPFEALCSSPLTIQRLSGLLPVLAKQDYCDLLSLCQDFTRSTVQYVEHIDS